MLISCRSLVVSAVLLSLFGCAAFQVHNPASRLLGAWKVIEVEGEEAKAFRKDVTEAKMVFNPDCTYLAVTETHEGNVFQEKGTFTVEESHIVLISEDGRQSVATYTLREGVLVVRESTQKAWLKRVSESQ